MKIAVLSGKGGTGKTTVAVNLANTMENSLLIDCDVEEANAHLYFKPEIKEEEEVYKSYPIVDPKLCNLCGECGDFCNFNAIIPAKNQVVVFKETCHDCGGCKIVCKQNAITYEKRSIGKIYKGRSAKRKDLIYGVLNIGEFSGVKIIENLKDGLDDEKINIIDCPPGVSCSTVAAVEDVDYALIVAEPTPFGLSDMKMVVKMLQEMKIKFSLVINKSGFGDKTIEEYCDKEKIEILGDIKFNARLAWYSARAELISERVSSIKEIFLNISNKILSGDIDG